MFVESIELNNYRNFDSLKVEFSPGVNIFFGDNAQGKTNLLESIYVSGTLRSHRGSRDKELIRFGEDEAHIRLFFRKDSLSHRLDVHLKKNKSKGVAVDGVPVRRSGELLGMMHIVFFSPEDLSIIKEGPAGRRRFLDMELSQIDKGYMQQLVAYSKILNERNNLLKQINLYLTDKHILFEFGETKVVSRLLEGKFYNIGQMLSNDYETKLTINKMELLRCLDRSTLFVKESDKKPIILKIENEQMNLMISSQIGSMKDQIVISKEGKDLVIGFNPKFLVDALRVIDEEEVTIYLINSIAPCIIRDEKSSYLYLILPINVSNSNV